MASMTAAFRAESEKIHLEHQQMMDELVELERALERLVCYSEVFADLGSADIVRRCGRLLAEQLPEHCHREEERVLETVADVSPELSDFVRQMKGEHQGMLARLGTFCRALDDLEHSPDLDAAVCHLKEEGSQLTGYIRRHVAVEEHELSGFL